MRWPSACLGLRLLSQVANCPPEELTIGMPVDVVFEAVSDDVTLPKFRCT